MKPVEPISKDEDMEKATEALIRAAKEARRLALQTGTNIVVMRGGKLISEIPSSDEFLDGENNSLK